LENFYESQFKPGEEHPPIKDLNFAQIAAVRQQHEASKSNIPSGAQVQIAKTEEVSENKPVSAKGDEKDASELDEEAPSAKPTNETASPSLRQQYLEELAKNKYKKSFDSLSAEEQQLLINDVSDSDNRIEENLMNLKAANFAGKSLDKFMKMADSKGIKAAELCKDYGINVTPDTVFTHYEFGLKNPKTSSAGKIDINYLPHQPALNADEVGKYIRSKVSWYLQKI
jgi:hypothetical protein